jgi:hypothetical protein
MTRTRFAGCHRSTAANLVDVFKKIGRILIARYAVKKTARNYGSFVALVCGFILVRSLPTA